MTRKSVFSQSVVFVSLSLLIVAAQDSYADEDAASQLQQAEQKQLDELAKSYRLHENQLVGRFVPPFPQARDAFVEMRFQDHAKFVTSCRLYWDKERFAFCNASLFVPVEGMPFVPEHGATLSSTVRGMVRSSRVSCWAELI